MLNLGQDKSDSFREGERVEALYHRLATPSKYPDFILRGKNSDGAIHGIGWDGSLNFLQSLIIAYLAKLIQTEKKEEARRTT